MIETKSPHVRNPASAPDALRLEIPVAILFFGFVIFLVLLIRTAWQPDDTYTAWRLVDNLVHGFGLRNNIAERVQTFTSTLWTMLNALVYFFTRNIYYTSVTLSILTSIAAVWIAARPHRSSPTQLLYLFASVMLSISFMDFTVSGFENPLSHLIMACFAYVYLYKEDSPQKLTWLFFIAALAGLNRLDTPLFYVPALLVCFFADASPFWPRLRRSLFGLIPLFAWHIFALIYFGFPLQNAAYAKRFNGIPTAEFLRAGIDYYMNSISRDPLTLITIATALVLAWVSRDLRKRALALGIALYLCYVLYIGGDYMSGRFFSTAFFASVLLILNSRIFASADAARIGLVGVVALGCLGTNPTFRTGKDYGSAPNHGITSEWLDKGIADERASWYPASGLLHASRFTDMPKSHPYDFRGAINTFISSLNGSPCVGRAPGNAGYFSYYVPRECHIYDLNGQVDPLMARMPNKYQRFWRQGHLFKDPVPGYHETLVTGENRILDPDIREYYEKLRIITRGEIWSWERFRTIVAMNLGRYDYLLANYSRRNGINWGR